MSFLARKLAHPARIAALLSLLAALVAVSPGSVSQAANVAQAQQMGAITVMAVDNNNNGWGWASPLTPTGDGHIVKIENGAFRVVAANEPATTEAVKVTVVLEKIALTNDAKEGWATGTGGGPRIWHIQGGTWKVYKHNLPFGTILEDITISADGTDGWLATAKDLVYRLFRLRNGQWVEQKEPAGGSIRRVSISPDGKQAWAIGPKAGQSGNVVFQWVNGSWVACTTYGGKPAQYPQFPAISALTVDNSGNGWLLGGGDAINTSDKVLTRLSADGPHPVNVSITAYPGATAVTYGLHGVKVDGFGRGWATGVAQIRMLNGSTQIVPLQFWLKGDNVTEVSADLTHFKVITDPAQAYYLPSAVMSPDGSHSWLVAWDLDGFFIEPYELHEPWEHDSPVAGRPLPGQGRCFDAVDYCLRGVFAQYWEQHGGLAQFGYPITPEVREAYGGTVYTVQYTERARLEYHPENKPPFDVLLGRLGADVTAKRTGEQPFQGVPPCGSCDLLYFPETQHAIGLELTKYWQSHGGIPVFGFPISEAFDEKSPTDGKTYLVQYFERNRLEYHPENKGTQYEVLLGRLGAEQFGATYGYQP